MTPLEQAQEWLAALHAAAGPDADHALELINALDDGQTCREWYETATEAIEDERIINDPAYERIDEAIQAKANWSRVVVRLEDAGIIDEGASPNQVFAALSLFLPD